MKFGQFHSKASEYDAAFQNRIGIKGLVFRIQGHTDFGKQQRSFSGFGQRFLMVMDHLAFQWVGGNFNGYGYCFLRNLDTALSMDMDTSFLLIQRCKKFNIRLNLFGFFALSFDKWKKIRDKGPNPPVPDSVKWSPTLSHALRRTVLL